ncbi:HNH endonuclease [Massilia sp. DD77]|uniref:HNH endonuclease n=1 Tax=Massilia sp. DD77 TaxID=3109349 RepID=UPI002FFFC33A
MPRAAPRPCSHIGCKALVSDGSGRCEKHPRESWVKTTPTKRITGRRLQKMRADLFARHPLCVLCLLKDRVTTATQRDHKIPLEEGGPDDSTNEQAVCDECHAEKSQAEAARGRRRARPR